MQPALFIAFFQCGMPKEQQLQMPRITAVKFLVPGILWIRGMHITPVSSFCNILYGMAAIDNNFSKSRNRNGIYLACGFLPGVL